MIRLKLGEAATPGPLPRTASVVFDSGNYQLRLRWDDTGENVENGLLITFCANGKIHLWSCVDPLAAAAAGIKLDLRGRWFTNFAPGEDRP